MASVTVRTARQLKTQRARGFGTGTVGMHDGAILRVAAEVCAHLAERFREQALIQVCDRLVDFLLGGGYTALTISLAHGE